jgi:hypothetical protein
MTGDKKRGPEPIAVGTGPRTSSTPSQYMNVPLGTQENGTHHGIPRLLLDARDTAVALSISERTLWGLTKKGEIPCVRILRRVLYDPRALQVWIDGRADNTAPVEAEGGV